MATSPSYSYAGARVWLVGGSAGGWAGQGPAQPALPAKHVVEASQATKVVLATAHLNHDPSNDRARTCAGLLPALPHATQQT